MNPIDEIIGTVVQILLFACIPFLVYLFKRKTAKGFFGYIGLKKSTKKANRLAVAACLIFVAPMLVLTYASDTFRDIMIDPGSLTGKFRQWGPGPGSAILLVVIAVFKTSFAEELFFRGFVAKRLVAVAGFIRGNVLQAVLFGAIHAGLFALSTHNPFFLAVIFLVPAAGAYVSVYLNEKLANGSIVPGWISHGLANMLAYGIVGFVM